ncbi:MAG: HEAT repeat domain-containing protein [Clostridiales bacterium]|jgi:HEAT repeat protein|nr:HEAT repeat domain-containing protein [Eubacteriales bacterium]MDH7565044.1 HEAT repeat domain-containing protein [Clostridiales bacterium]
MNNGESRFNEQELTGLIHSLRMEKERYKQEELAQKIGSMKCERTAELVAHLLYSEDAYIRNMAIELLICLEEKALPVLKEKMRDRDRNIRKFAMDALKHIKGKHSCEIALAALEDPDQNVVEAALEVIGEQSYKEATGKLLHVLEETNSLWIINALLGTFEKLKVKELSGVIGEKILSMDISAMEKNILMNTYVRALGTIGSYPDVELILYKYSRDFLIEDSNLVFGLCGLIVNNEILRLPEEVALELERVFKEHWDYRDSDQLLVSLTAFVQLQMGFFLCHIKEIYDFYKGQEFFTENLHDLVQKLDGFPAGFLNEILACQEPELVMLGLKLIRAKQIRGFNGIVEDLCRSQYRDISELAISIIAEMDSYRNAVLLEKLTDFSDEAEVASVKSKWAIEPQDMNFLLPKLEHQSKKVRRVVAQKLTLHPGKVNLELLEEIVRRNSGEAGIEALEVLFRFNPDIGWRHITSRMDCMDENVRAGLIGIVECSSESLFYSFMNTMINDPSPVVRKRAIKALYKRIDDRSLRLLERLYEDEWDVVNRMEIILNLCKFKNDNAFRMAIAAAGSSDTLTRIAAVKSLSLFHTNGANDVLKSLLDDRSDEVREAAREALLGTEVMKWY